MSDHPRNKVGVSYRLSPIAIELIAGLAGKLGVSQASIVEMAVRKMADVEGVKPKEEEGAAA